MVKILRERDDVIPDKPDNKSRASRQVTASKGSEGVVGILLAQDGVSPDESKQISTVEHHSSKLLKVDTRDL